MASLSIIDKAHNHSHLHHFVVQTRTFQIEKARNVEMYGTLREYIKRQNEKRKQEMEMSEELKRARREKELKHKRDKFNLGEVKDEICKNEAKLSQLQNEKHQLFTEFKKVLNKDETQKDIQKAKEAAHNNMNITFGVPSTTASGPPHKTYQSPHPSPSTILPNSSHAILPTSLHHLQPIQPMFFSQSHAPSSSTPSLNVSSSSLSASQAAISHHRLSGRVPTPTTFTGPTKNSLPPGSSYSKPMAHHPGSLSASSASLSHSSTPSIYQSDRHRLSYKRSHEQASPSPVNLQTSVGGVISGPPGSVVSAPPPSHLMPQHYIPNYKPPMGQPSMPPLPPGAFAQLGGQHVIPNLDQLNLPLYQSLFSPYSNPMYMNNPNPK